MILVVLAALLVLAAVALALAVFGVPPSALRAAVVTGAALVALSLGGFASAWVGYRAATVALAGASPTSQVSVDPGALASPLAPGEDATARAWRLWLEGRLRVEPEPGFLAVLRSAGCLAPEASLELVRELSPHEPSV